MLLRSLRGVEIRTGEGKGGAGEGKQFNFNYVQKMVSFGSDGF